MFTKLTQTEVEDVIVRALKTFSQAFIATLLAGGFDVAHLAITKQALLAAMAAGVSAVVNFYLKSKK